MSRASPVAQGEDRFHLVAFRLQFPRELREVLPVLFHFFALVQTEAIEVSRRPTVGDMDQRLRMTVKYEDYKQYKSQTTITFGEEIKDAPATKPPEKK